jgi:hypothetical protein
VEISSAARFSAVGKRTSAGYAYRVAFLYPSEGVHSRKLVWIDEVNSKTAQHRDELLTGAGRRLKASFLRWMAP